MTLTLDDINKRLEEIPQQIAAINAEQHQLLGYRQALQDAETKNTPQNGEVMPLAKKEKSLKSSKQV
tara:strand:- start:18 stop:218 length:201 start_codon:yes stop_codon:yes gene_type:complete